MLPYEILPVNPLLRDWIESIFIMNIDFTEQGFPSVFHYPWSVSSHLYFTLRGDKVRVQSGEEPGFLEYPQHFIIAPRLSNDIVDLGPSRHVAGIAFRPGGLYRLLGIPVPEVYGGLDLSLVIAKQTRELSEQLLNAQTNKEIFALLEKFLLNQLVALKPITSFELSVTELVRQNGNPRIKQAADWAGLSTRQFERLSLARLGVSPKLYSRLIRFTNACIYKESHPAETWTQVAYQFGYADQMHLIDDVKNFSGATPTALSPQMELRLFTGVESRL